METKASITGERCIANGCQNPAILMAIDNFKPVLQRKPLPACRRHVILWDRQARGSFWWFPLGVDEAKSLNRAEVEAVLATKESD